MTLAELMTNLKATQPELYALMSHMPMKLLKSPDIADFSITQHWNCLQLEYSHDGKSVLVLLRTLMKSLVAYQQKKNGGYLSELLATNKSFIKPSLPPHSQISFQPWKEGTIEQIVMYCDNEVDRLDKPNALEELD